MAGKATLKTTYGFADGSKLPVEMGPYETDASVVQVGTYRTNCQNFNSVGLSSISNYFVSEGGASCIGIVAAEINIVNETPIPLKGGE